MNLPQNEVSAACVVLGDAEGHARNRNSPLILKTLLGRKGTTGETIREKISEH